MLSTVLWEQRTQKMYDKTVLTPRLTAWYGEAKSYNSADSNITKHNEWTPELYDLKERIEKEFDYQFNGVLLNLYRDNNDSVAWHRDKESRYGKRPVIASISLGQTRNFDFRKKGSSPEQIQPSASPRIAAHHERGSTGKLGT
ncbi:alpha-ketoglutarate-dependent dioxygenase AlkB [Chryseobacterium arachidis]|uniref:alpha-ketoglutarate-dependent dioxygenase AlkB n=1 Tax=Chryseobacterium arachidis TaxID=1416778 RepID=UPI00360EE7B8